MARSVSEEAQRRLRELPQVGAVLERADVKALAERHGTAAVTRVVRQAIEAIRATVLDGREAPGGPGLDVTRADLEARLAPSSSLRPMLNATGVLVHTNLGRSPLAAEALEAAVAVGRGYATLEYDAEAGARGDRHHHATGLLTELTGAEDAAVVNNCAAALLLALSALGKGREVVVSRGELVEIGGGFRVPDVMAQSGARLVEVGTTNRTWLRDYRGAAGPDTAAFLKVHRSNFEVVGFVAEVEVKELATLGRELSVPVVVDAGSGCLIGHERAERERTVRALLDDGADLVMFSGDKLLGGPQAGVLVGRKDLIERCRRHPLMRALRPDKLCLAALVATLRLWRDRPTAVPLWRMATTTVEELRPRADRLRAALAARWPDVEVVATEAPFGGGTSPLAVLDSVAVALGGDGATLERLARQLRAGEPGVVARTAEGQLLLDLRTVDPVDDDTLAGLVGAVLDEVAGAEGAEGEEPVDG